MASWFLIALGGACGSVLRHAAQIGVQRAVGHPFPVGTLLVNVLGCLLIGVVAAIAGPLAWREEHRLAVMTGLLGGFTTFSAFSLETASLAEHEGPALALAYIVLSVALGLVAVYLGLRLGERLVSA
jgi:fluoride exporter